MPNSVSQFERPWPVSRWRWCARNDGLCMKNEANAPNAKSAMAYSVVPALPLVRQTLAATA